MSTEQEAQAVSECPRCHAECVSCRRAMRPFLAIIRHGEEVTVSIEILTRRHSHYAEAEALLEALLRSHLYIVAAGVAALFDALADTSARLRKACQRVS